MNDIPEVRILNPFELIPALNPIVVTDGAGLQKVKKFIERVSDYAPDYETNITPTFFHRRSRTFQLGNKDEQYVIDLLAIAGSTERLIRGQGHFRDAPMSSEDAKILEPFVQIVRPSLEDPTYLKVGQNLEYEYMISRWCFGMLLQNLYCTQVAEEVLLMGRVGTFESGHFSMEDLVRKYCRLAIDKTEQKNFDLETPLTTNQVIYCALDVRLPYSVRAGQMKQIEANNMRRSVQIEFDYIAANTDTHLNGMYVNAQKWNQIYLDNKAAVPAALEELDSHFLKVVGPKIDWEATKARVDQLEKEYQDTAVPSEEEKLVSAKIREARGNRELLEELKLERERLQTERLARRERAKEIFYEERKKVGAKAREVFESQQGKAAINYSADKQLLAALHAGPWGLNKKNLKSTDAKKSLKKHDHLPVIQAVIKHRKLEKQISTYGPEWMLPLDQGGNVDPDTNRLHSKFKQLGTVTGRPSSSGPNLLNIPKEDKFRDCFEAPEGKVLVCKDCAGQELRIITEISQEPSWIKAFNEDMDVHSISAETVDPQAWAEGTVHEESVIQKDGKTVIQPRCAYFYNGKKKCKCPKHEKMRDRMKAINFGIAYGKEAYSLATDMKVTKDEAQKILDKWKLKFSITSRALDRLRKEGYSRGFGVDLSGGRRYCKKVTREDAKRAVAKKPGNDGNIPDKQVTAMHEFMIAATEREIGNMPIQMTGAKLMKLAMGQGHDSNGKPFLWHVLQRYKALQINFIYDEIVVECPEEFGEEVDAAISDAIVRAGAELIHSVPMVSTGGVSKRWNKD